MAIEVAPPEPDLPDARKRRDMGALWRLFGWGGSAAVALAALAVTAQTESGSERLQLAFALENQPARAVRMAEVTPGAAEKAADTRALEAQVSALAADRDRLNARIANLEHNLNDMTGSIKRQTALAPAVKSAPPAPSAPATSQQVAAMPAAPSMPAVTPTPPVIAPLAMPASADTAAAWPGAASTHTTTHAAQAVPLPPARIAAAPTNEPAAAPPHKPEFGVDLGGAPNMEVLHARWAAVKANFGPLLAGLHPLAAHDRRAGSTDLRLLVGPLPNVATAAQLCGRFAAARVTCRPTKFAGERMATR